MLEDHAEDDDGFAAAAVEEEIGVVYAVIGPPGDDLVGIGHIALALDKDDFEALVAVKALGGGLVETRELELVEPFELEPDRLKLTRRGKGR
jgi:hypothetical protein